MRRARFIIAPNFSELEHLPVVLQGQVHLVLTVSRIGTIDGIRTVKSDPIPSDLLTGIHNLLAKAHMEPALDAAGQAVASEIEIIVGFEPEVEPLAPN